MTNEERITALEKEVAALRLPPKSGYGTITDIQTVFLQYCSENDLSILEAAAVLDGLKDGLQRQKCRIIPRDPLGGNC
ncbi:hypothetical protein [Anaerospora hongkongensis]|uniref:hypothetical protein n=1 Tax=Anaerospora hongkongensis TaxID=244830 RepID=UPI002FD94BED